MEAGGVSNIDIFIRKKKRKERGMKKNEFLLSLFGERGEKPVVHSISFHPTTLMSKLFLFLAHKLPFPRSKNSHAKI